MNINQTTIMSPQSYHITSKLFRVFYYFDPPLSSTKRFYKMTQYHSQGLYYYLFDGLVIAKPIITNLT
eukprot:UN01423